MIAPHNLLRKLDRGFTVVLTVLMPVMVGAAFYFITAHFQAPLWLSLFCAALISALVLAEETNFPWRKVAGFLAQYRRSIAGPSSQPLAQGVGGS